MNRLAGICVGMLLLAASAVHAEAPPAFVIAVANRDVEGAIVLDADEERNYQPTGMACHQQCANNTNCNLWVWCGAISGCSAAGSYVHEASRFQQCWLKFDFPLNSSTSGRAKFPRAKNLVDQRTGWMSGVIVENFTDSAPFPERSWSCGCSSNYTYGSYRFEGTCNRLESYGSDCLVDAACRDAQYGIRQGCFSNQPCTVLLDTDLNEQQIIVSGEELSADSAEECNDQCANAKNCNLWTWCSDVSGCNGERYRFRQCWLKNADPSYPQPKKGYGGSPGWISGVRQSWIPV